MPLKIPLLFHFNQHLTEYASLASKVCYTGLLKVLLSAPVKSNIHISGTLIQSLNWLDPVPLEMIRTGLASGKFELLGSTHAQNVPYATDDRDNADQIRLHQDIIRKTFHVRPTTFWNPERCWRQSLHPVITAAGYEVVTIEDHILDASGLTGNHLISTGPEGRRLKIIRDDGVLKDRFNFSAWFGDPDPVLKYLAAQQQRAPERDQHFAYAEDAEAMGLWGYHAGVVPQQTWDRLAALLDLLAAQPWFEAVHFRDLPEALTRADSIADGAAAWMDAALTDPSRPYHEEGYADWFDFNRRSEKLRAYRSFYTGLREQSDRFKPQTPAQEQLQALSRHAFLTHQYEFGCIGIGGQDSHVWRDAEAARLLLALADGRPSDEPARELEILGETVLLLNSDDWRALVTPTGGRLLLLVDLKRGTLVIGNPGVVAHGRYGSFSLPPEDVSFPDMLVPDIADYQALNRPEAAPTRLRKYLPDSIWDDYTKEVALATMEMRSDRITRSPRPVKHGAFWDHITINGQAAFTKTTPMNPGPEGLQADLAESVHLIKNPAISQNTVAMVYTFTAAKSCNITVRTAAEIAGDYAAVLSEGRRALDFHSTSAVILNGTGERIEMLSSAVPTAISRREGLLALIVEMEFNIELAAGETHTQTMALRRLSP